MATSLVNDDQDMQGSDSSDFGSMDTEADKGETTGIEGCEIIAFAAYSLVPDQYGEDKQIYNMMFQLWLHGGADIKFPCYSSLHQAVETIEDGKGRIDSQRDAWEQHREKHVWNIELLNDMEQWTLQLTREGNDGYPEAYHVVGATCRLIYESRIRCYKEALRLEAQEVLQLVCNLEGERLQIQRAAEAIDRLYDDAIARHSQRALREYEETRAQYPREAFKTAEANYGTHTESKDTAKAVLQRFTALHQTAVEATIRRFQ